MKEALDRWNPEWYEMYRPHVFIYPYDKNLLANQRGNEALLHGFDIHFNTPDWEKPLNLHMHEVGHTAGMRHSDRMEDGKQKEYGDWSCMMGKCAICIISVLSV